MTDNKILVSNIIKELRDNLDTFEAMWEHNSLMDPIAWPAEIDASNAGVILEQFIEYNPELEQPLAIDIDNFINTIGYTNAYNIVKRRPPMAQCYSIAKKAYYHMEAYCINLDALKERLDELTKNMYVVVTFAYCDHDWPYATQKDIVKRFNQFEEIEEWQVANTGRRESLSIKETRWLPGTAY